MKLNENQKQHVWMVITTAVNSAGVDSRSLFKCIIYISTMHILYSLGHTRYMLSILILEPRL